MRTSSAHTLVPAPQAVWIFGVPLLCLMLYVHFTTAYVGDKIWLLFSTNTWLGGKELYVDIFEVNPPLIYWIYSLPVGFSRHFPLLHDYNALALFGFAVVALTITISMRLIRFNPLFAASPPLQRQLGLLLATVLVSFTSPLYFFDREHIFLVLIMPYLLRFMPSVAHAEISRPLRILISAMAAVGFCIKPHCVLVFACLQIILFMRTRSLRTLACMENIIICLSALAYIAAVFIFTPAYIHVIIPMALITYGAINRSLGGMLFFLVTMLSFGVTFADFRLRYTSPYRRDILYFVALCPGFIAYALANNGWGYTWNLLGSIVSLVTGFVLWEFVYLRQTYKNEGLPFRQFVFGMRACLINYGAHAVIVMVILYMAFLNGCGNYFECAAGKKFLENVIHVNGDKPLKSFGSISISADVWTYLSRETGAEWDTRFNHLWMLPRFFDSPPGFTQRYHWILEYVGKAYAEDMHRYKPELMFVDDNDVFFSVHKYIDLVRFLSTVPEFREEWRHYRFERKINGLSELEPKKEHTGYFVYRRID